MQQSEQAAEEGVASPHTTSAAAATTGPAMVAVRRRRRRRRRTAPVPPQTARLRVALLVLVTGLILLTLVGGDVRRQIGAFLKSILPSITGLPFLRFEVIALLFAALIILYLLPGVEDKVLIFLGVRKRRRHGRGSGRH